MASAVVLVSLIKAFLGTLATMFVGRIYIY